jgi:hypothetical protein
MVKTMRSRPAFQNWGPEFHHKIGTKRLRVVFNSGELSHIKIWASYVNTSAAYRARAKACAKLAE